jgi:FixJ family two-component response regulator
MITQEDPRPITEALEGIVFVVDDDEVIRQLLCSLVRSAGFAVEAYASAEEFLEDFDAEKVGCLILDIGLPGIDGMELQQRLNSQGTAPPIIFVTGHGEVPLATHALRAGALDFLPKPCDAPVLLDRIREGFALHRKLHQKRALAADVIQRISHLTGRESQIMHLLSTGDSPKKIAAQLSICIKTVDNHRIKIFEKMQVENATQLTHLLAAIE